MGEQLNRAAMLAKVRKAAEDVIQAMPRFMPEQAVRAEIMRAKLTQAEQAQREGRPGQVSFLVAQVAKEAEQLLTLAMLADASEDAKQARAEAINQ